MVTDQQKKQFALRKLYVKDLSFESPRSTDVLFNPIERPDINLQLNTESNKLEDGVYEVVITVTVTAGKEDATLFLIEVKQAGLFSLQEFSDQEMAVMLNSYCPNILFPYAREVVSNVVERGGFPQLLLKPINFDVLYKDYLEKHLKNTPVPASASKN